MTTPPQNLSDFSSLLEIVKALRGPNGCPWDKEQTPISLAPYAIEEAHELAEALEREDEKEIIEELGDVLLQVALHSEVARQEERFQISDVIYSINEKMVRRHPHVFSNLEAETSDEVMKNWQKIKAEEKKNKKQTPHRFDIPENLPALQRSKKIGSKTKKLNFDWETPQQVLEKVDEELAEVKEAISQNSHEEIENEIGDLLFSVAQLARHLDIEPEQALRKANRRFEKRFFAVKSKVEKDGGKMTDTSSEKLEELWQEVKKES